MIYNTGPWWECKITFLKTLHLFEVRLEIKFLLNIFVTYCHSAARLYAESRCAPWDFFN
jgi:hypothetical protein